MSIVDPCCIYSAKAKLSPFGLILNCEVQMFLMYIQKQRLHLASY